MYRVTLVETRTAYFLQYRFVLYQIPEEAHDFIRDMYEAQLTSGDSIIPADGVNQHSSPLLVTKDLYIDDIVSLRTDGAMYARQNALYVSPEMTL